MPKNKLWIFLFLFTLGIGCQEEKLPTEKTSIISGEMGYLIDSVFTPYTKELRRLTKNTAGLAIGVVNSNEVIYARTFGMADIENQRKK